MGAFLRLYTFLSQIFDYGNTAIEKRSIFYKQVLNAVMSALEAHTTMSTQALNSEAVREGLKDVLLGPAQALRSASSLATAAEQRRLSNGG